MHNNIQPPDAFIIYNRPQTVCKAAARDQNMFKIDRRNVKKLICMMHFLLLCAETYTKLTNVSSSLAALNTQYYLDDAVFM